MKNGRVKVEELRRFAQRKKKDKRKEEEREQRGNGEV